MIDIATRLFEAFLKHGVSTICGVPDSVLAAFSSRAEECKDICHVLCANEGSAIAYAAGTYLATAFPSVVYLQSAGIGNAYNPLISMATNRVNGIPMILLIGWRGRPGGGDEPQHSLQGEVLLDTLSMLGIEYHVLDLQNVEDAVCMGIDNAIRTQQPVALVIPSELSNVSRREFLQSSLPSRREVIATIVRAVPPTARFVATAGFASRELAAILEQLEGRCDRAFLVVGAMGHASQIAMGIAQKSPSRTIVCIDGDGAAQMHLGSWGLAYSHTRCRLIHVVINNGCHDSIGGQPVSNPLLSFTRLAIEFGYPQAVRVTCITSLSLAISDAIRCKGEYFIEVVTEPIAQHIPPRPKPLPFENKQRFMSNKSR